MPFSLSPLRIGLLLALFAALLAGLGYLHHQIYQSGFDDGVASVKKADEKALAHNTVVHDQTQKEVQTIDVAASVASSAAQAHTTVVVRTVEKVIHENPQLGAIRRPPELARVRAEQIARMRALANPSPGAASGGKTPVSASSL